MRILVMLFVVLGLSLTVALASRSAGLRQLDIELAEQLLLTRHAVTTEIERYRYLPAVISQDARILALLRAPAPARVMAANLYLRATRDLSGADEIYLLNPEGVTLAASNFGQPGSFMGEDYSFRPYFTEAMAMGDGRSYAVGVTTGVPGYFLASRIGPSANPLGVAVTKVNMAELANTWARTDSAIALADAEGVVFLAGQQSWAYRPLEALAPAALQRIAQERRYSGIDMAAALPLRPQLSAELRLAEITLPSDHWRILAARPLWPVAYNAWLWGALTALTGLFLSALGVNLCQRQRLIRERIAQNVELERRVAARTADLASEVEMRKSAQEELRRTHDQLVHAAKLAVLGRMSSTIVHEVSQPLSALDSTLAAAELHLGPGGGGILRAGRSLAAARALLVRLQKMVRDLRRFGGRHQAVALGPVDMAQVLAASQEVLAPRLKDLDQRLEVDIAENLPLVRGDAMRLEQVVTNLLLNAAEAAAAQSDLQIASSEPLQISIAPCEGRVVLCIYDRGPGITPGLEAQIFEPFFTTRLTGEGLGLGLSITRSILDQLGGDLKFHPRPGGGTVSEVTLTLFSAGPET